MSHTPAEPTEAGTTEAPHQGPGAIVIAGVERQVERVSARKASAAFGLIRAVSDKVPGIIKKWATFKADYARDHATPVDRAMAQMRYGPQPALDPHGAPLVYPDTITVGDEEKPHPHAGELVILPSPLDSMTEEAWEKQGNKFYLPGSPSVGEQIAAVFDDAIEVGEDHIYRLLALALMPNEEVKRRRRDGSMQEALAEQADDLVDDAYADELVELAVVFGEVLEEQFRMKAAALEGRMGNTLRLIGLDPARWAERSSTTSPAPADGNGSPPASTPTSSSDTPAPSTDGPPTPSSTSPPTSSPPLVGASSSSD